MKKRIWIDFLDRNRNVIEDVNEAVLFRLCWGDDRYVNWLSAEFETYNDAREAKNLIYTFYRMGAQDARKEVRNALGIDGFGGNIRVDV